MSNPDTRKLSRIFGYEDLSDSQQLLSSAEIDFFKKYGFLVKKRIIDPAIAEQALDEAWKYLKTTIPMEDTDTARLSRHDPTTWVNPPWAKMPRPDASGFYEGRQRAVYSGSTVKLHDIGDANFLLDLLPNNPNVREIGERFLGPLKSSERTRGIYALFPDNPTRRQISSSKLGPHTDRVCQQLNLCTYLSDVKPRGGGFTIYPASHKLMHFAHVYSANWSPNDQFRKHLQNVVESIEPIELVADAGDVIFWHGRLVHSAGIHVGAEIRWAVFGDYSQDRPILSEDQHRDLGQYEWFKDTRLFENDSRISDDMWEDWRV